MVLLLNLPYFTLDLAQIINIRGVPADILYMFSGVGRIQGKGVKMDLTPQTEFEKKEEKRNYFYMFYILDGVWVSKCFEGRFSFKPIIC